MHKLLSKLWEIRAKRAKGDNGFTLIELLVVVVILGVLIAIAIPLYLNYRKGANDAAAQSDLKNAISTLEQCNADNAAYPASIDSAGVITTCANQKISLSSGTSLRYALPSGSTAGTAYIIADTNSNGSGKFYCYNSTVGGPVRSVAGPIATVTC